MILLTILQLWFSHISTHDRAMGTFPHTPFWGAWQSCLQEDNEYGERIFPYTVNGTVVWTLHLGPNDEFALYRGKGPADLDPDGSYHSHDTKGNLLAPAFHYNAFASRTGRNWSIPELKLKVNVVAAGGSRPECESFEVKVEETIR